MNSRIKFVDYKRIRKKNELLGNLGGCASYKVGERKSVLLRNSLFFVTVTSGLGSWTLKTKPLLSSVIFKMEVMSLFLISLLGASIEAQQLDREREVVSSQQIDSGKFS